LDVPCLAISDTDVKTQAINVAIPANDKGEAGALYYNKIISDFVVLSKLNNVLLWFLHVRKDRRLTRFFS
jgi:ribosomal protein S2